METSLTVTTAPPLQAKSCAPAPADLLERYALYLTGQRALSDNTRRIYLDDLHTFLDYCRRNGHGLRDMDRQLLRGYVAFLATAGRSDGPRPTGYARVSIVRKLTALRTFYNFLVQEGWFASTPVPSARSFPVKVEKPLPSFLGKQEATRLLAAPDDDTPAGIRDRAILELLYACGVRLAELQGMNMGTFTMTAARYWSAERATRNAGPCTEPRRRTLSTNTSKMAGPILPKVATTAIRCSSIVMADVSPAAASRRLSATTPPAPA